MRNSRFSAQSGAVLMWTLSMAVIAIMAQACGRYRPPLPPELLAPSGVINLSVQASDAAVAFAWTAADVDRRGKELKSAEGFLVERKELVARGDETDPSVEFKKIGFLADKHVQVREKLREEARAAGKVGRTVESPAEHTSFAFTDSTPVRGKTYLYQIVPVNQGGTRGKVEQLAKVVFQGAQSAVVMVPSKEAVDDQALLEASAS
jgi:hypothetical protein